MYEDLHGQRLSVMLSEVLDDIGVNENIVRLRRDTSCLKESIFSLNLRFHNTSSVRIFGSSAEGTTTYGLQSDIDTLFGLHKFNVITDLNEWKPGINNLLMIQENNVAAGYCLLQVLRNDAPLPVTEVHHVRDRLGRVLLKKSVILSQKLDDQELNGPSLIIKKIQYTSADNVFALPCKSSHPSVKQWMDRQTSGRWPTDDTKRRINNSTCYVVPVGCKGSVNEELEWRISTSEAERCLMFSLNITQIRTYVLMKMLLKCKINRNIPEENAVSSFMCKNVLLRCIEDIKIEWENRTLLTCLWRCLSELRRCIMQENCPHFIIQNNNLMAGKCTDEATCQLLENIDTILDDLVTNGILRIDIDYIGAMFLLSIFSGNLDAVRDYCRKIKTLIKFCIVVDVADSRWRSFYTLFYEQGFQNFRLKPLIDILERRVDIIERHLKQTRNEGNDIECSACAFLLPVYYSLLGSLLASLSLPASNTLYPRAIVYLSLGADSDVASGRLKLATVYYCIGDIENCKTVLKDVERRYDFSVCEPVCSCNWIEHKHVPSRFQKYSEYRDENDTRHMAASCVIFTSNELVPKELRFEMFRSTGNELKVRVKQTMKNIKQNWLSWCAVDSLTYLYFLQYKTYSCLQRHDDQQRSLKNLALYIDKEPNLGHRETAFNLLGQCMELEKRHITAFKCYFLSLKIRPTDNVARVHICRLLNKVINN